MGMTSNRWEKTGFGDDLRHLRSEASFFACAASPHAIHHLLGHPTGGERRAACALRAAAGRRATGQGGAGAGDSGAGESRPTAGAREHRVAPALRDKLCHLAMGAELLRGEPLPQPGRKGALNGALSLQGG